VVMLLALGPGVIVAAPSAQAYTPSPATVAAYEHGVIYWVNANRTKYGRAKLRSGTVAVCPDRYANGWSSYLARTGYFYHRDMHVILSGCHATVAAENLARGFTSGKTTVNAWMHSPGHKANIMDRRLTRIGVAAVYAHGRWTVTANFTRP